MRPPAASLFFMGLTAEGKPVSDRKRILGEAEAVLREAAARLVAMQGDGITPTRKERLDIVTEADLAAERILIDGLGRITPDAAFVSEEQGASGSPGVARWIIDPLDGTVNYAAGLPWYSATIAYQERGRTVLGLTCAPA